MRIDVEIIMKPINEIIPYWRNPRRNDKTVEALVEEIKARGFNVPIVIDKNGVVVKGHARLKAAKRLGMDKVPCVISNASEEVIRADRIADNKIQELSSWDYGKLNLELDRIEDGMKFKKLFRPEENPVSEDFNEIPELDFKPAGLDFSDEFHEENVDLNVPAYSDYREVDVHVPDLDVENADHVPTPQLPAQEQEIPQKKHLKTICPYCGKVVIINV